MYTKTELTTADHKSGDRKANQWKNWQDSIANLRGEVRLADWREVANSQVKQVVIHSGKNINWHCFRNMYINMLLSASIPLSPVVANPDKSMKYIQEHYLSYWNPW